jgi:hypothetical protein
LSNKTHLSINGWDTAERTTQITFDNLIKADDARETKGNYHLIKNKNDKTRTSNSAISEAAYQVSIAAQHIYNSESHRMIRQGSLANTKSTRTQMPWEHKVVLPLIITTARLQVCEFNASDIDIKTGEIPFDKTLLKEVPFLSYEYRLPPHFQAHLNYDFSAKLQILIVNGNEFPAFLRILREKISDFRY